MDGYRGGRWGWWGRGLLDRELYGCGDLGSVDWKELYVYDRNRLVGEEDEADYFRIYPGKKKNAQSKHCKKEH